ncbi:MAG TPA: oxidoreductase [Acidimicrobiales bacterium]|nr:oxidoreductase [Acidimicrobiales bacterium]
MQLELEGKVAVVTGASRGIGLAVTRALVSEGAHVVAGARSSTPELDALVEAGSVESAAVDLATPSGAADLAAAALAHGRIDILVNNVGAAKTRLDGFLSITDEDWTTSLTLNLMAAVRMTRAVLPSMIAASSGAIVTTSSVNAFLPDPAVLDYSAAKAAVANFSKSLSKEVAAHNIRVNTVSPGPVSTALWLGADGVAQTVARATGGDPDAVAQQVAADAATGRFTTPEEVADLIVFLASARAGNVTGADFTIDGGLIKTL